MVDAMLPSGSLPPNVSTESVHLGVQNLQPRETHLERKLLEGRDMKDMSEPRLQAHFPNLFPAPQVHVQQESGDGDLSMWNYCQPSTPKDKNNNFDTASEYDTQWLSDMSLNDFEEMALSDFDDDKLQVP